jgi:hypothetical protein
MEMDRMGEKRDREIQMVMVGRREGWKWEGEREGDGRGEGKFLRPFIKTLAGVGNVLVKNRKKNFQEFFKYPISYFIGKLA